MNTRKKFNKNRNVTRSVDNFINRLTLIYFFFEL